MADRSRSDPAGPTARPGLARLATPVGLGLAGAVVALLVGHLVFPHLSTNHDEAVYLQQAAMLLDGRLFLHPPVADAFRPWFFVDDGGRLYSKYAPVPAAVFALGKLLGGYRVGLALAAGAVVAGTYGVTREVFADRDDRGRLGIYAAGFVLASPLFVVQSGLFLPYLPTTALNLCFAYGYLRGDRTGRSRWAALAGVAIGLAAFARPYTAVLFALPFVAHALWTLREFDRDVLVRQSLTAALGLAGVAATLGYNAVVTGDPLTFPYEAFAPRDGLGFGRRGILGYGRNYAPALALRANAEVLAQLFGRWVAFGALGSLLGVVGLIVIFSRTRAKEYNKEPRARRVVLAGLFLAVAAGNVYFWGNLNVLGRLTDPFDGLVHSHGPFYHFDLLVPTASFAAVGARATWGRVRPVVVERAPRGRSRSVVLATFIVAATVLTATGGLAVGLPVAENARVTDQLDSAYEPVEERDLDGALVFLPTPYGDWLNHPFQRLRNDPGFDGQTVYAIDGERPFAVVDAYPNRTYRRYAFRGPWAPFAGGPVEARLQSVHTVRGERATVDAAVGVPASALGVSVTLATDDGQTQYVVDSVDEEAAFRVVVENGTARIVGDGIRPVGNQSVRVGNRDTVVATAFVDYPVGGFDYRIALPVEREDGAIRALTPRLEVCRDARLCGGQAAYVPGAHRPGVSLNATLVAEEKT